MAPPLPERASAVVIGGGVIGASTAYHLAKLGWNDVLLLERARFAGGTTWHAAGLIGTVRPHESLARLLDYSRRLLTEIEEETGQSTGFRAVGSLAIAHSADRFEELKRLAAMSNGFGITRVELVTAEEIASLYPLINKEGLIGGTWVPTDGMASPVDVVAALVRGARDRGARCLEGVAVTAVHHENGRVTGVGTDAGDVRTEFVVNCAGLWGREIGRMAGVNVPLYACEHYYAHTEKIPDLPTDLPTLRDYDIAAYIREDAGSLLVGAFEPVARPIDVSELPADFCFDELPGHAEEQLLPILEDATHRIPVLGEIGWRSFFCGPESFTPDDQFHIGEAPGLGNFFVACGLNSVGIQSGGGVGKAVAEWMDRGHAPLEPRRQRRAADGPDSGHPALPPGAGERDPGPPLRATLSVPAVRDGPQRAPLAAPRAPRRARSVLRRDGRMGTAQLVCPARRRAGVRVFLRPPELVRAFRGRAPGGARGDRPLRPVELHQVPRGRARCDRRAATHLHCQRRCRSGAHRLHPLAERARRHRSGTSPSPASRSTGTGW